MPVDDADRMGKSRRVFSPRFIGSPRSASQHGQRQRHALQPRGPDIGVEPFEQARRRQGPRSRRAGRAPRGRSADAAQIAQQSPVQRASASRPPSRPWIAPGRRRAGSRPRGPRPGARDPAEAGLAEALAGSRRCRAPCRVTQLAARRALAVRREADALSRESRPPWPSAAISAAPAGRRPGCAAARGRTWWPARTSRRPACRAPDSAQIRDPEQAARVGRRAVADHAPPQTGEAGEHRVQRIERARPRRDQDVGAGGEQALHLGRHRGAVAGRVAHREELRAEPVHLSVRDASKRWRCPGRGSHGSGRPARAAGRACPRTSPPALPARLSAAFRTCQGMASGVSWRAPPPRPSPPAAGRRG